MRALKRQISTGEYRPLDPRIIPVKEDKQYRSWTTTETPQANAVVIYVMESNPGREGAAMADALRAALDAKVGRERVKLIPDDSIGRYAPHCDCALVGVDSFDASGAIWHKTGTLPLAKLCRALGKPFYVAGHTLKRSSRELGDDPPKDPETGLQFFDRTPGNLITRLITESS
jgi:translation initiation factor 2B subunit (eIF-2B alpha/beta/delta family)